VSRFARWLRGEDDRPGPLPLLPGPVGNGEFVPRASNPSELAVATEIRRSVDEATARAGIDRRHFLQSAGGVAACLGAFNLAGCSAAGPTRSAARARRGGSFTVPPPHDLPACREALSRAGGFIFDVHTHHVMPDGPWRKTAPGTVALVESMLPSGCTSSDRLTCVDRAAYLHDVFLASDTTVAMVSDVPNSGPSNAPLPFSDAMATQHLVAQLAAGGASRLYVQNVIAPNVGDLQGRLDGMTQAVATGDVAAFKVYTAWSPTGRGYSLEDPKVGLPAVQHAHDLGVRVLVAHKGLPLVNFDPSHNGPEDVVAVSRLFPDMNFVIFHAAWDPRYVEGPYNPGASRGIDTLLAALDRHGVAPGSNVWVDLGSLWRQLLTTPTQAAHALGKLVKRVGENRVLWGTDAIWYGGPQPQIMAFRAFQISAELQERYGYPALTEAVKARILGLNAAELFGVDPHAVRCTLASDPYAAAQPEAAQLRSDGALPSAWAPNGPITRRQTLAWLASSTRPWTPA
jgi:hypothetical protein